MWVYFLRLLVPAEEASILFSFYVLIRPLWACFYQGGGEDGSIHSRLSVAFLPAAEAGSLFSKRARCTGPNQTAQGISAEKLSGTEFADSRS